ncbi:hypothetical protein [Kineosporia babensis]|uniref:Uncharacterized protein n=1 Tax=Kineosporia babensis TaxID=499548 RepID=A0A9X1NKN1_9ACTN|nr:hypothetical protein [Kineosporia babensis]MCD5315908.1 hypothetical protein [Kineosporia babensis]
MFVPVGLLGLTMVVMGLACRRLSWRVRALTPAIVWAGATVVLSVLWQPLLMPLFEGPPV